MGKKILLAPLDWGLGHATRCIPLIHYLLKAGCDVSLAGEGPQELLLKKEFPQLPFLLLKGYRIKYDRKFTIGKILYQVPNILSAIRSENKWLEQQVSEHKFDIVISDNRFGLYNKSVHCIFITHQLLIKSPFGKWSEKIIQHWNYKFINRFNECWVPDEKESGLAGELSHSEKMPAIPVIYIGALSRFVTKNSFQEKKNIQGVKDHLLILLSGPEPQRSILEKIMLEQLKNYQGTATMVRGLPGKSEIIPSSKTIFYHNHLGTEELKDEILKAEFIICRSGYSSIMDLTALQKKTIMIPTPGQTEQEYLADYLSEKQIIFTLNQEDFSLQQALTDAKKFNYHFLN